MLVWIHGGGFTIGSGTIPYYAGDTFARTGDLVVVTVNYRLGPLGFLPGMGDDENLWLGDQATALRCTARSGPADRGGRVRADTGTRGGLRSRRRDEPARRVGGAPRPSTVAVTAKYAEFGKWRLAFLPVLDEETMPRHPAEVPAAPDLELLVGWTEEEATFPFVADPRYDDLEPERVVDWLSSRHERPEEMFAAYAAAGRDLSARDVRAAAYGYELFRRPGVELLKHRAVTAPAFGYEFALDSPAFGGALGATHCLDFPFTFAVADRWTGAGFLEGLEAPVVDRNLMIFDEQTRTVANPPMP